MNSKIGLGIVGLSATGGWTSLAHVPALANLADYEIRGLVASTPTSAKAAADKYGVRFWTDSSAKLASRPEIDLVVVADR
jgi:predicted dehydrogenase